MARRAPAVLWDDPRRYGLITRILHWSTALLILWQFGMAIGWLLLGDGMVMRTARELGPSHGATGALILMLSMSRICCAVVNGRRRPSDRPPVARLARWTHVTLYGLLAIVPVLALLRTVGTGQDLRAFGAEIIPATGHESAWLAVPADRLHSPLAWFLLALVCGHALAALFHGMVLRDGVLGRMAGELRGRSLSP